MRRALLVIAASWILTIPVHAQTTPLSAPLIAHEWGTFTSLQDEAGRTIGGINSDDEPVPFFCHSVRVDLIQSQSPRSQGVPRCHRDVTMRLETPVLYFHLPPGASPITLDVTATFAGGWLTEFYPDAIANAPGLSAFGAPGHLTSETTGSLAWKNVHVGGEGALVDTTDHVWTTPRNVQADKLTVNNQDGRPESEKFLFYRGVGHVNAPLRVVTGKESCDIYAQLEPTSGIQSLKIGKIWQYQMRDDGRCAYRLVQLSTLDSGSLVPIGTTPSSFNDKDFSADNLARLRGEMHEALVGAGLFSDEADALLGTWELSYFKSSGMRLLFLVPQAWTDQHLPLRLSVVAKITRAMVGRIDLVTPTQRALLKQIARSADLKAQDQAYEQLGRFRNGLLLDEQRRNTSLALLGFIDKRGLKGFGE